MFFFKQKISKKYLKFNYKLFFLSQSNFFNSFEGLLEDSNVFKAFIERKNQKTIINTLNSFNKTSNVFSNYEKIKIDASVLILLFSLPNLNSTQTQPWILFTKRSSKLRLHPNEISFPGGKIEQNETFEEAALREAHEEIGLSIKNVNVWGNLKPILTSKLTSVIGVVGILNNTKHLNALKLSYNEVDTIFAAPLNELVYSIKYTIFRQIKNRNIINYKLPIFYTKNYFIINSNSNITSVYKIWGITAIILYETLRCILRENDLKKLAHIN